MQVYRVYQQESICWCFKWLKITLNRRILLFETHQVYVSNVRKKRKFMEYAVANRNVVKKRNFQDYGIEQHS